MTDYDKLTLEVWTNGAVSPSDAVSLSAKLIRDHLNIFVSLDDDDDEAMDAGAEPARAGVSTSISTRASRSSSCRCDPTTA